VLYEVPGLLVRSQRRTNTAGKTAKSKREVSRVSEVVFILSREDVIACAKEMSIPEEAITDDVLYQVKKGVEWGLECWTDVVKTAIREALAAQS